MRRGKREFAVNSASVPSTALRLEDVADLHQQLLRLRAGLRVLPHVQPGQPLHHPEDGEADDEKVDDRVDEQAEVQRGGAGALGIGEVGVVLSVQRDEYVGEIDAADHQPEQRIEHILHQAVDHAGEGNADDDADGEVHDAAAHDEGAEFTDPGRRLWQKSG